jgi:hypothetical protein
MPARATPLLLLLLTSATILAQSPTLDPIPTLEWLTEDADIIVLATVADHTIRIDSYSQQPLEQLTLHVTRTLKSALPLPTQSIVAITRSPDPALTHLRCRSRGEGLFFLHQAWRAPAYANPDGLYLPNPTTHFVALPDPAYFPDALGPFVAPTNDFRVLWKRDDVLAAVAAQIARPPPATRPAQSCEVTAPWDITRFLLQLPDVNNLNLFGGYFLPRNLRVPDDDRWRVAAIHHALRKPEPADLPTAVGPNGPDPAALNTPAAVEALEPYLHDPDFTVRHAPQWPGSIPLVRQKFFYRREFAADLLASFKIPVADDVRIVEPALDRRPFSLHLLWLLALPLVVPLLLARRGTGLRRRAARALLTTTTLLALGCAILWHRSHTHYDELLLGTSKGEYELSSCFGRLQFLRIDEPAPYGSLAYTQPMDNHPDHIGRLFPGTDVERWGLNYQIGHTPISKPPTMPFSFFWLSHSATHPYRLIRVSWPIPTMLFALPPALWLLACARNTLRRRHRLRNNLCPACAYDLRATPGQCPECGWRAALTSP